MPRSQGLLFIGSKKQAIVYSMKLVFCASPNGWDQRRHVFSDRPHDRKSGSFEHRRLCSANTCYLVVWRRTKRTGVRRHGDGTTESSSHFRTVSATCLPKASTPQCTVDKAGQHSAAS